MIPASKIWGFVFFFQLFSLVLVLDQSDESGETEEEREYMQHRILIDIHIFYMSNHIRNYNELMLKRKLLSKKQN